MNPRISEQFFVENVNNLDFGTINKRMNHFDKEQPVSLFPSNPFGWIPGIVVTNLSCIGSESKYPGFFALGTSGFFTTFSGGFELAFFSFNWTFLAFSFFLLTSLALKGQLISKGIYCVFKSNKKPTKFLLRISTLASKKRLNQKLIIQIMLNNPYLV